jgi:hypothetical protein
VIYFPSEQNLAPVSAEQVDSSEPASKSELFTPKPSATLGEELIVNSGDIFATALIVVPRYDNRKKSVKEVTSKLESVVQGANLGAHIAELRQSAFDTEILRREELKKAEQVKQKKKEPKEEPKDEQRIDSIFSDETETPDSDSGKKLWD